ncbi:FtsX-like permease family protein [Carboxylicivirga sp. N1Y90]|uniref:FtsX-like permease family protein n=1 Tax=Carboxylicivirga fragile TaxID=3417571 RepID=UPI003D33F48F|nr:ABC transporter permease [Marinilabiliaceae bacterium N1Y90]
MKLALSIARRYLLAKKTQNVINIISMISAAGVFTASMALLIVLSVFNGLHGFIGDLYGTFDPDLKLIPASGKVISLDTIDYQSIVDTEGVEVISKSLEDRALLKFSKRSAPGLILGVDSSFNTVSNIDSIIVNGVFQVKHKNENRAVIGSILADQLALRLNFVSPLSIIAPKRTNRIQSMPSQNTINTEYVNPTGIFSVRQSEYDGQYVIINLQQAQKLFQYDSTVVSALNLKVSTHNIDEVQSHLQQIVGDKMIVQNREQQHAAFFKMMKIEKFVAYLILSFIMMIAAFNVIGTISLLIFEKKESIFTLKSMGASRQLVTRIFLFEGLLISLLGVILGLIFGILLVAVQQHFGLIKFGSGGSYLIEAYPVKLVGIDILYVLLTVTSIAFIAAWYPVRVIVRRYFTESGMP